MASVLGHPAQRPRWLNDGIYLKPCQGPYMICWALFATSKQSWFVNPSCPPGLGTRALTWIRPSFGHRLKVEAGRGFRKFGAFRVSDPHAPSTSVNHLVPHCGLLGLQERSCSGRFLIMRTPERALFGNAHKRSCRQPEKVGGVRGCPGITSQTQVDSASLQR